jgi:hypothetical protein
MCLFTDAKKHVLRRIRVAFTIADLNELDQDADKYDDEALYDDDDDGDDADRDSNKPSSPRALTMDAQSGGAQSTNTIRAGRTPDGNIQVVPDNDATIRPGGPGDDAGVGVNDGGSDGAKADAGEDRPRRRASRGAGAVAAGSDHQRGNNPSANANENDDEDDSDDDRAADGENEEDPTIPIRLEVTVEKPGRGALVFDTVANDGAIVIDSVNYFADADMARTQSADRELAKRDLYMGPPFPNLDEDLQVLFERYLDERGVNTALALFVPDYVEYKEQREYMKWLSCELMSLFASLSLSQLNERDKRKKRSGSIYGLIKC